MFATIRTALKLVGTVVDLNDRLTALEGNFDILDRAVKRASAQERASNSRARRAELEAPPANGDILLQDGKISPIGGVMKRRKHE